MAKLSPVGQGQPHHAPGSVSRLFQYSDYHTLEVRHEQEEFGRAFPTFPHNENRTKNTHQIAAMADVDMTDAPTTATVSKKKKGAAVDGEGKSDGGKRFEVKKACLALTRE